ncbi:MAG: hypothetical protein KIT34_03305 [Cyanobacteria bacterium TGS_CYA1]|nr:hypothetical protein [Cyanobacteria bacterium TGS_CYA1]
MKKGIMQHGVTKMIRRHLRTLEIDEPFTTRDLLNYGNRSAIDDCIYRLIQEGTLHRITRGVFVKRRDNGSHPVFTQREVAEIKAGSFGRKLQTHPFKKAKEIAIRLGLIRPGQKWIGECEKLETTYEISGPSSSFMYLGKRIYFKKTTRRKIQLGDSRAGLVMRAIWYNGFWNRFAVWGFDAQRKAYQGLYGRDRDEIHQSSRLMPAWLSDILNLDNNDNFIQGRPILVA